MGLKRYSKILQQDIEVDHEAGILTTEDGAIYTQFELSCLQGLDDNQKRYIHYVKRLFKGEIVD